MTALAVSSFSFRQQMGPVTFRSLDAAGDENSITLDAPHETSIPEFIGKVRAEFGVDAIEICQVQLDGFDDARIDAIGTALDEHGVSLLGMPIDTGDVSHPLDEVRERSILATVRWFDVAARLGSRYVRVNPLSGVTGEAHDDSLRRLADAADHRRMHLLFENKGGLVDYPQRMLEVQRRVGADRVGIILDTGNVEPLAGAMIARLRGIETDESDLGLEYAYEMIALMAPHATVVHAKSHGFDADGVQGPMDLDRALGIVRGAGFAGPLTIEYEGIAGDPWLNTRRTVELVRRAFA